MLSPARLFVLWTASCWLIEKSDKDSLPIVEYEMWEEFRRITETSYVGAEEGERRRAIFAENARLGCGAIADIGRLNVDDMKAMASALDLTAGEKAYVDGKLEWCPAGGSEIRESQAHADAIDGPSVQQSAAGDQALAARPSAHGASSANSDAQAPDETPLDRRGAEHPTDRAPKLRTRSRRGRARLPA